LRLIKEPKNVKNVAPKYPADAMLAGLTGKVVMECNIDAKGAVTEARVLDGPPPLTDAAITAVKQWRYAPVMVDGKAVPAIVPITITFAGPHPSISGLLESLKSKNEFIREFAVKWLGTQRGNPELHPKDVDKLTRNLQLLKEHDESERVRTAAAQALVQLKGK
jgi:TonB family protein